MHSSLFDAKQQKRSIQFNWVGKEYQRMLIWCSTECPQFTSAHLVALLHIPTPVDSICNHLMDQVPMEDVSFNPFYKHPIGYSYIPFHLFPFVICLLSRTQILNKRASVREIKCVSDSWIMLTCVKIFINRNSIRSFTNNAMCIKFSIILLSKFFFMSSHEPSVCLSLAIEGVQQLLIKPIMLQNHQHVYRLLVWDFAAISKL
jgi:hypothetical protein